MAITGAALLLATLGVAQVSSRQGSSPRAPAWPWDLRFSHIHAAMTGLDYETQQVRRAEAADGETIALRENLSYLAARNGNPERFELRLLGVEGRSVSAEELVRRQRQYEAYEGSLFYSQGFRVVDPTAAERNYRLLYLGDSLRAGRPAYRLLAAPVRADRSLWLLEVDQGTGFPLYSGEYDTRGRLVGELDVTSFRLATPSAPVIGDWWAPRMGVKEFADPEDCLAELAVAGTVAPAAIAAAMAGGFAFEQGRVVTSPFNGEKTAALEYTDGIDQVFVQQTRPNRPARIGEGHTFLRYEEAGMAQFMFLHEGLRFVVVGRVSRADDLRALTTAMYRRASN